MMQNKTIVLLGCTLLLILFDACSPVIQTVEVTRIVPQTAIVTQLVLLPVTTTPLPTGSPIPPTPTAILSTDSAQRIDLSAQDGSIVIVRYFTLVDLHLYEQAYDLLSEGAKLQTTKDRYLEGEKMFERVVKVLKVARYNDWVKQKGENPVKVSDDWYYVNLYIEGENGWAGAYPNGIQDRYIRVILEDGKWKVDEFSTFAY